MFSQVGSSTCIGGGRAGGGRGRRREVPLGKLGMGGYGFVLLGCLAGYGLALRKAYQSLEGMNGDISGYALTLGELCALAVLALI